MPFSIGDAFIEVRPELMRGFDKVLARSLDSAVDVAITGVAATIGNTISDLGKKWTKYVTTSIAVGTTANVAQFQALDAKIRETITLFGAGQEQGKELFGELRAGVREVSRDFGTFEQTISESLYQAISAGIPRDNVFDFMATAQKAAIGGALDLTTAVNGLTTAVNTFTGEGLTAVQASDILFRGVARGKTTFAELSREMASAAPLAANAEISFAELIATVSAMTLAGTPTAEAFTQVRAAITGLLRPTEEMTDIFREAGYESQAAAVQALGYQGALQVLFEATNGEVGALIKLLGGAEAANAALQVTGDNAGRAASILQDTEAAAGATNTAFETMQDGVGRTFGQLFAEIDRFGTTLGEIVSPIVKFGADAVRGIVRLGNNIVEAFSRANPVLQAFGSGLVLVTGALGPFLFILGKVLAPLLIATGRLTGFATVLKQISVGGLLRIFGAGIAQIGVSLTGMIPALRGVNESLSTFRNKLLGPLIRSIGLAATGYIALGAAVVGGIIAFREYNRWVERTKNRSNLLVEQTNKLAESLDLVVKPLQDLSKEKLTVTLGFRAENIELINQLREDAKTGLLESRLISIGYRLISVGNTPEEAFDAVKKLAEAAGVSVPVDFTVEDIESPENFINSIIDQIDELNRVYDDSDFFQAGRRGRDWWNWWGEGAERILALRGELEGIGGVLASAFAQDNLKGIQFLKQVEEAFGNTEEGIAAFDVVADEFLRQIGNAANVEIDTSGFTSFNDILAALRVNLGFTSADIDENAASWQAWLDTAGGTEGAASGQEEAIEGVNEKLRDQYKKVGDARMALQEYAAEIETNVMKQLQSIRDELITQIPLFGEYEGAAKRTPQEIIDSLNQFSSDVKSWTALNADLIGEIPEELRKRLNELPLEQRAALAQMAEESPKRFQDVLDAYEEAFGTVEQAAEDTWTVEAPRIIEEGNALLEQKARSLQAQFGLIGGQTARAWETEFRRQSITWQNAVRDALGFALLPFNSFSIDIPTPQPSGYAPPPSGTFGVQSPLGFADNSGGTVTNYNYDVNLNYSGTPSDPARDAERLMGVLRTQSFYQD